MKQLKRAIRDGWAVKIWPHYSGFTVELMKAGQADRIGRAHSVRRAVKLALR